MDNPILEQARRFSAAYGKDMTVGGRRWRYYRLGQGPALFWLTGGLRRVALGFAFMERMAKKHTLLAPDYPPVMTFGELNAGFEAMLQAEGIERCSMGGQSYGGLLAQAFLALHPAAVDRLILSSTGPADYGPAWLPVEYLAIGLVRLLPERKVKGMLAEGFSKLISVPEGQRSDWEAALRETLDHDLTRQDVVSHFAVVADLIRRRVIRPEAYQAWGGKAVALSAEDDPTQSRGDKARYERLLGRPVEVLSMGATGHTAALLDPDRYIDLLEQVLA